MNVQGPKLKIGLFYVNLIWLKSVTFSKRLHLENASFSSMFEKIFKWAYCILDPVAIGESLLREKNRKIKEEPLAKRFVSVNYDFYLVKNCSLVPNLLPTLNRIYFWCTICRHSGLNMQKCKINFLATWRDICSSLKYLLLFCPIIFQTFNPY